MRRLLLFLAMAGLPAVAGACPDLLTYFVEFPMIMSRLQPMLK